MPQTNDLVVECCHCRQRFIIDGDGRFADCPSCNKLFDLTKVESVFLAGMVQNIMRESLHQQAEPAA